MINLVGEVQPPQRHPQQEPQTGDDAIAVADAHAALGQVQLKPANIFGPGRLGGTLQKASEPLAAINVTPLRVQAELACVHVLDHALAQRTNRLRTHGQLLSGIRLNTSILKTGRPAYYR